MALTPSTMIGLGTALPSFSPSRRERRDGVVERFRHIQGPAGRVPVSALSVHVRHIRSEFARVAGDLQRRGIAVVGINSNDVLSVPEDGPDGMRQEIREAGYTFPYLFDESQAVAKAFQAACTPDLFLFDNRQTLVYRGQFDESRPNSPVPVTGRELKAAADALLAGREVPADQRPSMGCNIKWRK